MLFSSDTTHPSGSIPPINLAQVNEQITAKSAGKEEHFKARDEIKAKLDEYSERIDELEKKRKQIQDGISNKDKEQRAKRQELNDMKKKLGFQSEAEIDAEIKKIESLDWQSWQR